MDDYISISTLNHFIFCPYSIYLHNVYMAADEDLAHAIPQTRGKAAHANIDNKKYSTQKDEITGICIYSNQLGLIGKIDIYKAKEKLLIERKYQLNTIYQGQIYQLWAQYFCMIEMSYEIEKIAFYSIVDNKTHPISIPTNNDKHELEDFINQFKSYKLESELQINMNKCLHCIYCNLCDKTNTENVYT